LEQVSASADFSDKAFFPFCFVPANFLSREQNGIFVAQLVKPQRPTSGRQLTDGQCLRQVLIATR
jgi:hypothetical protein